MPAASSSSSSRPRTTSADELPSALPDYPPAGLSDWPPVGSALPSPERIIDCHIHFYDPERPGHSGLGAGEGLLHRTVLTEQALALVGDEGVEGAVLIECSPALEDNKWLLDMSDTDQFIVGVVGHVDPGPSFRAAVDRFASHPRFCGVRTGNASVEELRHLCEFQ